jgi:hypothetical protein
MIPRPEHVAPLESFTAQDFAKWLNCGFRDHGHPLAHQGAFAPLAPFLAHEEDPTLNLRYVYELLSGTAKERLGQGLAAGIANLQPYYSNLSLMRQLLHLAGRLKAVEAIPPILAQVATGFFGRQEVQETRGLYAFALEIIAGMAPGTGVADGLRHLVGSPPFESGYAPMVFIGLCRAEPDRFPEHMEYLRTHFGKLHASSGASDAGLTARRFAHYVPLDTIAEHLHRLQYSLRRDGPTWSSDNWLVNALFLGDRPPLRPMSSANGAGFDGGLYDDFWIARSDQYPPHGMKVNLPAEKIHRPQTLACRTFLQQMTRHFLPVDAHSVQAPAGFTKVAERGDINMPLGALRSLERPAHSAARSY